MTSKDIYRDYLIRYYPDSKDKHYSQLIGIPRLKKIVNRKETMDTIFKRVAKNKNDRLVIRLDRGCTIIFFGR